MTTRPATPVQWLQDNFREFRIERRHTAALTWDAMFTSRRAAILAGGGGGFLYSVTLWRPAEVVCSVPLLTVVITRVCRKPWISSVFRKNNFLVVYKKDERSDGHWWPVSNRLSRLYPRQGRIICCCLAFP